MTNEEKKLNEVIKQDGIDMQSEILEELKRRYPQYVEQSDNDDFEGLKTSGGSAVCYARFVWEKDYKTTHSWVDLRR